MYYKQRLHSAIQKIITIPAAMQKVHCDFTIFTPFYLCLCLVLKNI